MVNGEGYDQKWRTRENLVGGAGAPAHASFAGLSPARTGSAVLARASKNARRSGERVARTCKLNGRDKEHVFCEDLAILTVYGQTGLVIRATCLIYLGWFSGNTIFRGHRRRLPTSD
jgi:hypothetical protein